MLCHCGAFWHPQSLSFSSKGVNEKTQSAVLLPCWDQPEPGPPSTLSDSLPELLWGQLSPFLHRQTEVLSRLNFCFHDNRRWNSSYFLNFRRLWDLKPPSWAALVFKPLSDLMSSRYQDVLIFVLLKNKKCWETNCLAEVVSYLYSDASGLTIKWLIDESVATFVKYCMAFPVW